jgi:hypothetical protein
MNSLPWPLFLVLFLGMSVGILFALSRFGWSDLASVYRAERPFEGERWHWVSTKVGKTRWRSSLTVGANGEGLFLVPMIFFRVAHPALFIPWSDITADWKRSFGFQFVQLTARRAPDVSILVEEARARAMALAAGSAWPAPDLLAQIERRRASIDRGCTAVAYAAVAVLMFSGVAAGIGGLNVPTYWKLDRTGELAAARITSVEPENHYSLRYAYTVRGARYAGVGSIGDAGRAPIRPDAPLTIHYVPAEPSVSCLGDPHALLVNETVAVGMAATFLAVVALFWFRSSGFAIRRLSSRSQ